MPMPPPAPPRLSTTTDWPRSRVMASATGRPTTSASPPGGNGTTIVIVLLGYGACATARPAAATRPAATKIRRNIGGTPRDVLLACYKSGQGAAQESFHHENCCLSFPGPAG